MQTGAEDGGGERYGLLCDRLRAAEPPSPRVGRWPLVVGMALGLSASSGCESNDALAVRIQGNVSREDMSPSNLSRIGCRGREYRAGCYQCENVTYHALYIVCGIPGRVVELRWSMLAGMGQGMPPEIEGVISSFVEVYRHPDAVNRDVEVSMTPNVYQAMAVRLRRFGWRVRRVGVMDGN